MRVSPNSHIHRRLIQEVGDAVIASINSNFWANQNPIEAMELCRCCCCSTILNASSNNLHRSFKPHQVSDTLGCRRNGRLSSSLLGKVSIITQLHQMWTRIYQLFYYQFVVSNLLSPMNIHAWFLLLTLDHISSGSTENNYEGTRS